MKTVTLTILFILLSAQIFAQKGMQRIVDASKISTIDIAGNTIFKIKIATKPVQIVSMDLQVEGENNEQIVLQTYQENDTLFIGSAYQPLFVKPDDKLAAHKKISIELTLVIPENLTLTITSDIASVFVSGTFKFLTAELLNGHFKAQKYTGSLQVDTLHGNIELEVRSGKLDLNTKQGVITQEKISLGTNQISLNSINGNISVTKTQ
tara:strand:+ start:57024 stop:57647 length:624 start_codon:yes stop_codon:yes gene_type:complete